MLFWRFCFLTDTCIGNGALVLGVGAFHSVDEHEESVCVCVCVREREIGRERKQGRRGTRAPSSSSPPLDEIDNVAPALFDRGSQVGFERADKLHGL